MVVAHVFTLGKQRLADPYELKANLVYKSSSRTARATQRNPLSKQNKAKPKKTKKKEERGRAVWVWCPTP